MLRSARGPLDHDGVDMRGIIIGALLMVLVAACTEASEIGQVRAAAEVVAAPSGGASPTEVAAAGPAADCEVAEVDGELILFNWTEYMDPDLLDRFRDEFGVDVIEDFYPSNEEMFARVEGGGSGVDVVVPSDYMIEIMRGRNLLMPLNRAAVPNADNVAQDFASPPFDPELAYTMPYQWGTTGLGLRLEDTGTDPEPTWGWVFDPSMRRRLGGRISLLDSPREAMAAALAYLGHSINSTDEAQIRDAADLIAEATSRSAVFDSDQFEDLLVLGDTSAAQGYSGDFFGLITEEDVWDEVTYVIPEEGAIRWVDNMAVLADAPHPCTAHAFINFILDAQNGAQLTNWTLYASPNAAAEEFIDPEILEDPAIYPPEDVLKNLQILQDTGDTEPLYTDLFTEAKS